MRKIVIFLVLLTHATLFYAQTPFKYIKANIALFHHDTISAIQYLQDTLNQNSNQPYALKNIGNIYSKLGKYAEANDYYFKLLTLNDSSIIYDIVKNYAHLKNKEKTIEWLKIYLKTTQKQPENSIRSNPIFNFLNNEKSWNELWKNNWFSDLEIKLADIVYLYEKKDINNLIETIDEALKIFPSQIDLELWRAKAFLLGENHSEALKSINKILKSNPNHIEALVLKSAIFNIQKKYKNVATTMLQIYNTQPWEIQWKYKAAEAFNKASLYKESIRELDFYIQFDTTYAQAFYLLGNAFYQLKQKDEAIKQYTKAIHLYQGDPDYYYERALCYYDKEQNEKAFSDLCMALDLKPTDGRYYYQRGLVNYALNKASGACRDFERAKQLGVLKAEDYIQRYCKGK
ncbi:MAG: tetratricopeptide repeat protein [Bacteroidales bacterium]|nr:tetratricopeptide repeat protein [Bacteroidales bacterium]